MAEQGRTVRVSGLPTHLEEDRLKDKLSIHFLRSRNGGGEIASITIVKATPGSALLTFEDSRVAWSVLQHGRHILEVDEKKYELTLSELPKDLDPNMENHPTPGSAFRGGVFEAFLPLCERTRKLLPQLERAFRLGLTFTVTGQDTGARVSWDCIPHKTSLQGGKSRNGYPDSTYLSRLSEVLRAHGIEEATAKSPDKNKT